MSHKLARISSGKNLLGNTRLLRFVLPLTCFLTGCTSPHSTYYSSLAARPFSSEAELSGYLDRITEYGRKSLNGTAAPADESLKKAELACIWLAERGDVSAQLILGALYGFEGELFSLRNQEKWYLRAAAKNNHDAYLSLFRLYVNPRIVFSCGGERWSNEIDHAKKIECETLSASWYPNPLHDPIKAEKWAMKVEETGSPNWIYEVSSQYSTSKMDELSKKWRFKAAQHGHQLSQFQLAQENFHQWGTAWRRETSDEQYQEAIKWYTKVAQNRNNSPESDDLRLEACFNLGVIYADRLGEDSSLFDAEFWYKSAAAGGHRFAQLALAKLYARHYRNKEAAHWFLIVAKQGVPVAQEEVAKMYLEGTGLPQNEIEALAWAILAAAGSKMCAEQLDQMQMMDGYEDIKMQAQARALELSKDMPAPE